MDKAKADAKAKKLRNEREAASALEDFVKDFDADISDDKQWKTGGIEGGMAHTSGAGAGARVGMGRGARRHFTTAPKEVRPLFSRLVDGRRNLYREQGKRGIWIHSLKR